MLPNPFCITTKMQTAVIVQHHREIQEVSLGRGGSWGIPATAGALVDPLALQYIPQTVRVEKFCLNEPL
jgi:hypothetical protein